MIPHVPIAATSAPSEELRGQKSVELTSAKLALLEHLEASLQMTQQALIARDLAALEQGTGEQMRLCRALEVLGRRSGFPAQDDEPAPGSSPPQTEEELDAALQAAQARVLQLGRVQAALLVRAQRSLHMIANLLAGPQASYTPAPATAPHRPGRTTEGEREVLGCRV